jgi:hypothetical protein
MFAKIGDLTSSIISSEKNLTLIVNLSCQNSGWLQTKNSKIWFLIGVTQVENLSIHIKMKTEDE